MGIRVRLNRKFAQILNGIDLSKAKAGEEIDLPLRDAQMLIAEGWAAQVDVADDKPRPKGRKRKAPAGT